jgi:hypothetical protein
VTALWIVVGLAAAVAAATWLASWRRRSASADLGAVSSQWIAEQRLTQGPTRPH